MANKGKYARSNSFTLPKLRTKPVKQQPVPPEEEPFRQEPIREENSSREERTQQWTQPQAEEHHPAPEIAPEAEMPPAEPQPDSGRMSWLPKFSRAAPEAPPPAQEEEQIPLTPFQKAWNLIVNIFTWLVMALAVVMMMFTAVSVSSFDRNDRDILGYKFFIVRSDSMSATDFSAGDLVVIREVDPGTLEAGDIIAFLSDDPVSMGETFTHKIRSFTVDDYGQRSFITYGTTTGVDDAYPVPQHKILGQYQFSVPKVGTFFAFMKTAPGYICCIGIPFLVMLLIQGGNSVKYAKELYQEKQQESQSKLDAIHERMQKLEEQNQELREILKNLYHRLPPQ